MTTVFLFMILGFYFLPTIIGASKSRPNSGAIFVLNLFLGWTLVGWVIALVWATTEGGQKAVVATPTVAVVPTSSATELEKLVALKEKGALSEEEFQTQKKKVLQVQGKEPTQAIQTSPSKNQEKSKRTWMIVMAVLFVLWLIGYVSSNTQRQSPTPTPTQADVTPVNDSPYTVVNTWDIPNGGRGQVIIISPTNVNDADMTALGTKINKDTASDRNAFVFVFSDKKAALSRDRVLAGTASDAENAFYDSHFVGNYTKNGNSGFHQFSISLAGINGPSREITY